MNTVVDMLDQEVSEDGNWKWNGTDWVPNVPPPIQQVILEKSNTDSTKTRVSDLNFNTKTLSIVGGIVFLLFTTSISYYYFFMEEETFYHVTILINPEAKNLQNFTALVKTLIIFQKLLRMKNVNWSTLHPTTIHTQIMQLSLLKKTLTYILKSPCQ